MAGLVIQGTFPHGFRAGNPAAQRTAHGTVTPVPQSVAGLPRSPGQPLPAAVRQRMEAFFGAGFADVRVHTGPHAAAIGALAFTAGSDIHFAPGRYAPATVQGMKLIAHELAHVVQQRSGRARNPFGTGAAVLENPALEAEAARMSERAAAQPAQPPASRATKAVQRSVARRNVVQRCLECSSDSEHEEKIVEALKGMAWIARLTLRFGEAFLWGIAAAAGNDPLAEAIQRAVNLVQAWARLAAAVDTTNLRVVEVWHEDILSNLRQGVTQTFLNKRLVQKAHLGVMADMLDFLDGHTSLLTHLLDVREKIESSQALVRKISKDEALIYLDRSKSGSASAVFLKGKESMKAFAIDKTYSFKTVSRNQEVGSYDYKLIIPLTRTLKDFLIKTIYANFSSVLEISFAENPQFKFENDAITVLIPEAGWSKFWMRVSHLQIVETKTGQVCGDMAELNGRLWHEEHEEKLRAFNALDSGSAKPLHDHSSSYIS
jgi:hypothetical protein